MDKGKGLESIQRSVQNIDLNLNFDSKNPNKFSKSYNPSLQSSWSPFMKRKPPALVSLCLGILGKHLDDIIEDLEVLTSFPPDIKMAIAAIARRRKLLNDDVIIALAESSWEILDLSDSEVTDIGLLKVIEICKHARAMDISRCGNITSFGVSELVKHCHCLEILRWGGCPRSEHTARSSLSFLKPTLNNVEEDSWEELDTTEIVHGAQSLRWLVWPKIDKDSLESLSMECPRIIVNPKPSLFGHKGIDIPKHALSGVPLDDFVVEDIDPKTWQVPGSRVRKTQPDLSSIELPIAERFRLAFIERDARMAPKRAKNARQRQRRAAREWLTSSTSAKSVVLASQMSKNLHNF
ncbi:putative leucine-rich repeat domain superfamily [Helianthus annuus]|nr:putative leucine-rich repeat domain superfamily [Helianthus annuus]